MVAHLKETGMSYFAHMLHALKISSKLAIASFCCAVHSVFPFFFETTASTILENTLNNTIKRQIRRD